MRMLSLLARSITRRELGQAGRRHVYPRYDSSRLVDDMRTLYLRELTARGRRLRNDVGAAVG